jgi:chromosome segregation ATPase
MNQFFKILTILLALLFIGTLSSLRLADAQSTIYKYIDKNGNVHFTDNAESIPEQYRNQIKILNEPKNPETKPAPAEEEPRKIRDAEERKKEEEGRALREKAAREREEKQKASKDLEDRITELQDQIRAKQQEQGSLRTTWMVYDRTRLNQLNEEIASLQKQIESLQQELAEKK